MTDKEALIKRLETTCLGLDAVDPLRLLVDDVVAALRESEQEPVMVLPDGSAFGVMSFPLPDDHWLYAPNEYRDDEHEPIDLPKPVLTHPFRDAVVAAVRYAVRGATMRGQETDFDPDALVQNAVYALCGPYTTPPAQPAQRTEQEPVAFKIYLPKVPRQDVNHGMLPWVYDQDPSSGNVASMWVTPVQTLKSKK